MLGCLLSAENELRRAEGLPDDRVPLRSFFNYPASENGDGRGGSNTA